MEIEFDPAKDAGNRAKHGISLQAASDMDWETARIVPDMRRDYGEPRWRAIAPIEGQLHVLAFTLRGTRLRAISLRRASRKEIRDHAS